MTPETKSLGDLVNDIRTGDDLRLQTEVYRKALYADDPSAGKLKRNFKGFLPAALVAKGRDRKSVTALTGLVMCDFDHVPADRLAQVRALANDDPHTVLSYVTVSGKGLRVLASYRVPFLENAKNPEAFPLVESESLYRSMFLAVNKHYSQLLELSYDEVCKDLARLSFIAHDPDAFYRPDATPFTIDEFHITTAATRKDKKEARSRKNKDKNAIIQAYRWRILKRLEEDGIPYELHSRNTHVSRTGYAMNNYGFEEELVVEWAKEQFADYEDTESVIRSCYKHTEDHGKWADQLKAPQQGRQKVRTATMEEIVDFLKEKVEIRHNLVLGAPEMRWINPVYEGCDSRHSKNRRVFTQDTDAMVKSLLCQIEIERKLSAAEYRVRNVIENDMQPEYDPLLEYLKSLPEWVEGRDPSYIDELADTVRVIDPDPAAQDLFRRCLKKWMVAMVMGWLSDEVVNQTILTFIGAQGTYKSTWMKHLMPPQLKEYFKIKQNAAIIGTDDVVAMSRYGLILHEEVDVLNPRESNAMKAMSTAEHSDERVAYGRAPRRRDNIASLCATGNNEECLPNNDGTRRNLMFRVEVVKSPIDYPFNYEGIFGEAFARAKNGFCYYFTKEEQRELEAHNRQFQMPNTEADAVETHLRQPYEGEVGQWMRPSQVADLLSARSESHARYSPSKVGKALKAAGFKCTYHKGNPGYIVVVRNYDEVTRFQKQLALDTVRAEMNAEENIA